MVLPIPEQHYQDYKHYALDHYAHLDCYPFHFEWESDNNGPIFHYGETECQQMLDRLLKEQGQ